jgi:hypothetical protein
MPHSSSLVIRSARVSALSAAAAAVPPKATPSSRQFWHKSIRLPTCRPGPSPAPARSDLRTSLRPCKVSDERAGELGRVGAPADAGMVRAGDLGVLHVRAAQPQQRHETLQPIPWAALRPTMPGASDRPQTAQADGVRRRNRPTE